MATAYCVYRVDRDDDGTAQIRQVTVFWTQAKAVDYVSHLNSLDPNGEGTYSWEEAWVTRRDTEFSPATALTADDLERLDAAKRHDALGTERPVTVFFTFILNQLGARAICEDLRARGWPSVGIDEEVTGDKCWHAWGLRRRLVLNEEMVGRLREEMEDLAEHYGGSYDGWDVTGGGGLLHSEPGTLAT